MSAADNLNKDQIVGANGYNRKEYRAAQKHNMALPFGSPISNPRGIPEKIVYGILAARTKKANR